MGVTPGFVCGCAWVGNGSISDSGGGDVGSDVDIDVGSDVESDVGSGVCCSPRLGPGPKCSAGSSSVDCGTKCSNGSFGSSCGFVDVVVFTEDMC